MMPTSLSTPGMLDPKVLEFNVFFTDSTISCEYLRMQCIQSSNREKMNQKINGLWYASLFLFVCPTTLEKQKQRRMVYVCCAVCLGHIQISPIFNFEL